MDGSGELKTLKPVHMPRSPGLSEVEANSSFDRDQYALAQLGKKQVLKVSLMDSKFIAGATALSLFSGILHSCPCSASAVP